MGEQGLPQRFAVKPWDAYSADMKHDKAGQWVRYSDYVALEAKLAQLESQPSRGAGENAPPAEGVRERTIRDEAIKCCADVIADLCDDPDEEVNSSHHQGLSDALNAVLALLSQPGSAPEPEAAPKGEPTLAICTVCGKTTTFPSDDSPQFMGDTSVRSACGHIIHAREAEPEAAPRDECAYCGPVCYRGACHNARVEAGDKWGSLPGEAALKGKRVELCMVCGSTDRLCVHPPKAESERERAGA